MARFEWNGDIKMQVALANSVTHVPNAIKAMIKSASSILLKKLKSADSRFTKYWKQSTPKENNIGWFSLVRLKGKTESGAPAALAANVSEYGRQGYHPQPARPFIRATIDSSADEVEEAMQNTFDQIMQKVIGK